MTSHTPDAKVELVAELRAIRSNVDAFNPDARLAARSVFEAVEQVWKLVPRILTALEHSDAVMGEEQDTGVPFGPGSRPADRAASTGVSPVPASIPNAFADAVAKVRAKVRDDNARADALVTPHMIDAGNKAFETFRLSVQRPRLWSLVFLAMHDASAIEARRAETHSGSVADESAVVASGDETPEPSSIAPVQDDDAE